VVVHNIENHGASVVKLLCQLITVNPGASTNRLISANFVAGLS